MTEKVENTEIKIIRLNTGEDIIGTCLFDDDSGTFLVDSPMKVYVSRDTALGKAVLIMMPWLPLEIVDENLASISYGDVITMVNPKAQFVEYYYNTVDRYESLTENNDFQETTFDDDFFNEREEENDEEDNTIEEMLEIIKERKKNSIH
jgi:hypothetical protein